MIVGTNGNDVLNGTAGAEVIQGLGGDDVLNSNGGNDTLDGGDGNDILVLGPASFTSVTLIGGAGFDYLDARLVTTSFTVTLPTDIEVFLGGSGADNLTIANTASTVGFALAGFGGNDVLRGAAGNDALQGGIGVDTLFGREGDDSYYWNIGDGNDTFDEDVFSGVDRIIFGPGITLGDLSFVSETFDLVIQHVPSGAQIQLDGQNSDFRSVIEILQFADGSTFDLRNGLTITGTNLATTLSGTLFNDTIFGLAGNDTLNGDFGDDTLDGGADNDTLNGNQGADTLFGGAGTDTLNGNDGEDKLNGGPGTDTLNGGDGFDFAWYLNETGNLTINLATGVATGTGIDTDNLTSIENAQGGNGNDTITGSDIANILNGGNGVDTVFGGAGNDQILGGLAGDILLGEAGNDVIYGDEPFSPNQTGTATTILVNGQPLSISFTAPRFDADTGTTVFGFIGAQPPTSTTLNVVYVIDVSGSMSGSYQGDEVVGDQNGDGSSNQLIDAAIASLISLNDSLIAAGLGSTVRVSLVPFDSSSTIAYQGTAGADANGDGVPDVEAALRLLDSGGGTAYDLGLQQAIAALNASPTGANYLFFISDGFPNNSSYTDEVAALLNPPYEAEIRAIGLGDGASLADLDLVDDGITNNSAERVQTPSQLTAGLIAPQIDIALIDRIEIFINGAIVRVITPAELVATPFGFQFRADIAGLSPTAADAVAARVVTTGPNPVFLPVSLTVQQSNPAVGGDDAIDGGAGDDFLDGNAGNDTIFGGEGNDTVVGGSGDDTLDGQSGFDTLDYSSELQSVGVDLPNNVAQGPGTGTDWVYAFERVIGGFANDTLIGRTFAGTSGISQSVTKPVTTLNTSTGAAVVVNGLFGLEANGNITNATTVPHVTINGTASGAGADFYRFTVGAAGTGTFDIDGASFDTILNLYNANGVEIAFNDDGGGDPGSNSSLNSFITFAFTTPGDYFIAVRQFGSSGAPTNGIYTLHISAPGAPQAPSLPFGSTLEGNGGNDILFGSDAGDVLIGGEDDDSVDGRGGVDILGFDAARSNFSVRTQEIGGTLYTWVNDQVGVLGDDLFLNIEWTRFGSDIFPVAGAQGNRTAVFDQSRFEDVLFQNSATGEVGFSNMTGGPIAAGFNTILGALPAGWWAVDSADVTNDGIGEVFIQDTNTGSIYIRDVATSLWGVITTALTPAYKLIGLGDFTLDAVPDFLIRDETTGQVLYGELNAGGTFNFWWNVANLGLGWRTVGVGDLNRDGYSDVVFQEIATGITYFRDVANNAWGTVAGALGTQWIAKDVGDVTGDGFFDVIFQNTATGNVWYVDMESGAGGPFGVVANGLLGWDVRGVIDVNNDGYDDVVVQNTATGTTYVAIMVEGEFVSWTIAAENLGGVWGAI